MHRIVGGLSSTGRGGLYAGLERFASGKEDNYGLDIQTDSFLDSIADHKLVFLGEIHSIPNIVAMQTAVLKKMSSLPGTLHVIFEHFSFEMQDILEDYQSNKITFDEMVERYQDVGTENHDLLPYKPLLEDAKQRNMNVKLHGGFIPRTYARNLLKKNNESNALREASKWLPNESLSSLMDTNFNAKSMYEQPIPSVMATSATIVNQGSNFHYNIFESMLSGRNIHDGSQPDDRFKGMFKAQLLKDIAMAHKINSLLRESEDKNDRFLVIAGNGHLSHYQGVPERVLSENPDLIDQCCLVTSHKWEQGGLIGGKTTKRLLDDLKAGPPGANPADYLYVYQDHQEDPDDVKLETLKAYEEIGETANLEGNLERAQVIMEQLGYTQEEIDVAGKDAYNYQGVGNPHLNAKIRPGERVLDVGSGLGIDSLIAAHHAGEDGKVIGIDLSSNEVKHAQDRADDRELDIRFAVADMENIPLPDNCIDVIISNGAFCLAPNKEKAFSELYRVLRPGGRMAVCTTTIRDDSLEAGVEWPLCMRMFAPKDDLQHVCERVGFTNVVIDDSDSSMELDVPEELHELNPNRNTIHVDNSEEFEFLEEYDMDELCARVCVVAYKPMQKDSKIPITEEQLLTLKDTNVKKERTKRQEQAKRCPHSQKLTQQEETKEAPEKCSHTEHSQQENQSRCTFSEDSRRKTSSRCLYGT